MYNIDVIVPMEDPEVLTRGGELRGHKGDGPGEGAVLTSRNFLNFKSENGIFLCILKFAG